MLPSRFDALRFALPFALLLHACGDDPKPSHDDAGTDTALDADADAAVDSSDHDADATDATDTVEPPTIFAWRDPVAFEPEATFAAEHPAALARMSRWVTRVDGAARPRTGQIGGFGAGNGHVFALFGYGNPTSTMHTLTGPIYDREDGFFADYALHLYSNDNRIESDVEWVARSLSAPLVTTRTEAGDLTLDTVDFAPWTDGPERFCMVRMLAVANTGDFPVLDAEVRVVANGFAYAEGDGLVERRDTKVLSTTATGEVRASDRLLTLDVGTLGPGERQERVLLHCTAAGDEPAAAPAGDPGDWLDASADAYATWEAHLADFALPDPMLDDFVEGMKLTLVTQTASTGAACPMSQYTGTWARDNIGPALAWHWYGAFEEAREMIDYVYAAILLRGDLANSYEGALDTSELPAAPDWDAMPNLTGRVGGETPSYLVWIYADHARVTGSLDFVAERWSFLRRAMFRQEFSEDDLLPFTDDETYRAAMNAAFGLALEYPHSRLNDSANSSFLWLGAARRYEALVRAGGANDEGDTTAARFDEVEQVTLDTYLLDDGCLGSFRERETGDVAPPFEDVSLTATWTGWLDGDDAVAQDNVACMIERLGVEPGIIRSPIDEMYENIDAVGGGGGVLTGMLPGYTLSALTAVGHPDALASLDAMDRFTSTSGNFQEYLDATIEAGLTLMYDPSGTIGDYTAKYRPWEGGINLAAVLDYLFGAQPDAFSGRIDLRPHLPSGWPSMTATDLRIGDDRYDVALTRTDDGVTIEVTSNASTDLTVTLRWDGDAPDATVSVGGTGLEESTVVRREHFGQHSVQTGAIPLPAGQTVRFDVR